MSDHRDSRLKILTHDECMGLLRSHRFFGRIGYSVDGVPIILPINFVVDGDSIVFSTTRGSKLSWLSNHSRVSFQADHGRPLDQSGWSVLVHGVAQEVTDPAAVAAFQLGPLRSWAVPSEEHWVRISIDEISGRRLERRIRNLHVAAAL